MLIWLVLIPLIAAALIGLCKAPARPTALLSASLTLALGIWALVSFDGCSSCWSRFEGMDLQLTLAPALSKVMLLLTILVTFATVLGPHPAPGGGSFLVQLRPSDFRRRHRGVPVRQHNLLLRLP